METNSILVDSVEAAALLSLKNPGTLAVWRTTKRYPLSYIKVGRRVRYRREDIDAFILSRRQSGVETSIEESTPRTKRRRSAR